MRNTQQAAAELRSEWLGELVEQAAAEKEVSREVALKQIMEENRLRKLYRRLKPLGKGLSTGALSRILIPRFTWFYHSPMDLLFFYSRGAFYAHARIPGVDGEDMPFQLHRTRRPLPKKDVMVAEVTIEEEEGAILHLTREETELWEEITDADKIEEVLLERNADHLRQSTIDGTPFAVAPLNELFDNYGTNANADDLLQGKLDVDNLPLPEEARLWLQSMQRGGEVEDIEVEITPE